MVDPVRTNDFFFFFFLFIGPFYRDPSPNPNALIIFTYLRIVYHVDALVDNVFRVLSHEFEYVFDECLVGEPA